MDLKQRSEIISNVYKSVAAMFDTSGEKYDFGRMMYDSLNELVTAQKGKETSNNWLPGIGKSIKSANFKRI